MTSEWETPTRVWEYHGGGWSKFYAGSLIPSPTLHGYVGVGGGLRQ